MQSGESNQEYLSKLDELIEFFKSKRDKEIHDFDSFTGEYRFTNTNLTSTFAIFIAISIALVNFDKFAGFLILLIYLVVMGVYTYKDSKKTNRIRERYLSKIIHYDIAIEFLQYLKISEIEVDLSPIFTKIKQRFRDNRLVFEDYEQIWIKEIINLMDTINYKAIINQK